MLVRLCFVFVCVLRVSELRFNFSAFVRLCFIRVSMYVCICVFCVIMLFVLLCVCVCLCFFVSLFVWCYVLLL